MGGGVEGGWRVEGGSDCSSHRQPGPSTASVCSSSKRFGGVPQGGGGGGSQNFAWVGLGKNRGLLVPDACRQEAEANKNPQIVGSP